MPATPTAAEAVEWATWVAWGTWTSRGLAGPGPGSLSRARTTRASLGSACLRVARRRVPPATGDLRWSLCGLSARLEFLRDRDAGLAGGATAAVGALEREAQGAGVELAAGDAAREAELR